MSTSLSPRSTEMAGVDRPPSGSADSRLRRLWRGPAEDPAWARPALLALLVATALLYLVDLTASGWANDYYAAAAQSGSKSWTAWFFGGLDAGGAITVDKPPAALWVMGLSMRIFGVNSAALLVPQALMGVATVALVCASVRRLTRSWAAGLAAAALAALTPAAVVVFRFDNPDALMLLLLTAAAYAVVRALEDGRNRWLVLAGAVVGFAFLTKMGEALLVVPGLAGAYLWAGPHRWTRRVLQLLLAAVVLLVSAGWYIAVAALWPAGSRPYIAGSTDNSVLQLALGYNGLGRLLGSSAGSSLGSGQGGSFSGPAGVTRLFNAEMGVEISWLLPAALVALVAGLWLTRRAPRTDLLRASFVLWGGWLVVAGVVFDEMQGTIHPYYTAELVPAVSGLVVTGGAWCWQNRDALVARVLAAALVVVTAVWSTVLLHRTAWGMSYAVVGLVAAVLVTAAVLAWRTPGLATLAVGRLRVLPAGVVLGALLATGMGSAAWAVGTASTAQTGSSPTSGPSAATSQDSFSHGGGSGTGGGFGGPGGRPGGPGGGTAPGSTSGSSTEAPATQGPGGDDGGTADTAVVRLLEAASSYRWAAATTGSMSAAPLQLASNTSVMAIGGFTGSDPAPTLAQFKAWVAAGDVKYFIAGGAGGGGARGGDAGTATQISSWVEQHFTATTVGSATVYDLQSS